MTAEQLAGLLADHQPFHSDLQIDHMITGREGVTPYGLYRQALRELDKRARGLKSLYLTRERLTIECRQLAHRCREGGDSSAAQLEALELIEKRLALADGHQAIADTEREFARFYGQAEQLKRQVGQLTADRRAELDRAEWVARVRRQIALELAGDGRVSRRTLELVASLPVDMRRPLVEIVLAGQSAKERLMAEVMTGPAPLEAAGLDGRALPADQVAGLLQRWRPDGLTADATDPAPGP